MRNTEKLRQSRILGLVAVSRAPEVDTLGRTLNEKVIFEFTFTQTPLAPRRSF